MTQDGGYYFISAGELSGDLLASDLVRALKDKFPNLKPVGIAGDLMEEAGVEPLVSQKELSVMGFFEVLKKLPAIRRIEKQIIEQIDLLKPKFAILVDYPGFHFRLAKQLKTRGITVFQYVSPQVWAWAEHRVSKMKVLFDLILGILPFEEEFFKNYDAKNYVYIGSPHRDRIDQFLQSKRRLNLKDVESEVVALLPGSRYNELKLHLPYLMRIKDKISSQVKNVSYLLPLATTLSIEEFCSILGIDSAELKPFDLIEDSYIYENIIILNGLSLDAMASADAAVVCSGTATLECALIGTPMVLIYKMNKLTYFLAKRLVKVPYIGLVNFVAGSSVVPEHIQNIDPSEVANEIVSLLTDSEARAKMKSSFSEARNKLVGGSAQRASDVIFNYVEHKLR